MSQFRLLHVCPYFILFMCVSLFHTIHDIVCLYSILLIICLFLPTHVCVSIPYSYVCLYSIFMCVCVSIPYSCVCVSIPYSCVCVSLYSILICVSLFHTHMCVSIPYSCVRLYSILMCVSLFQGIHRRLRLTLERTSGPCDLRDCSGKTLRIEPLVSVDSLEKYLNGIVSYTSYKIYMLYCTLY